MKKISNILHNLLLNYAPRVLSMLDKNLFSSTYGSLDRKYWHYRVLDFPCGMQQELILLLAYLWQVKFNGNIYYQLPRLKEYIEGILLFHNKCCHKDGSVDDYFPYERAFGATGYSLVALTETVLLTNIKSNEIINTLERSGEFLTSYNEAGELANHLAIAALALINLYLITGNDKWKVQSDNLIDRLEKYQDDEGWFKEYEGCDIGYQTVTVEFLSRRYQKLKNDKILKMLKKNLIFLRKFIHPDGSFGGEYSSRNTYNFYPGGFAILSNKFKEAAELLCSFFKGIKQGTNNYLEDDGVFSHMLSSYITVLRCKNIKVIEPIKDNKRNNININFFANSGLFSINMKKFDIYGSILKGGCFKIFKKSKLIYSDTGFIGKLSSGKKFCQNNPFSSKGSINNNTIEIQGQFKKYKTVKMNILSMIVLRLLSFIFGKFKVYSNVIRFLIQKKVIYNKDKINIKFDRKIIFNDDSIVIEDNIYPAEKVKIESLYRTTDCVNAHVITSNSFQCVNLLEWEKMKIDDSNSYYFKKEIR